MGPAVAYDLQCVPYYDKREYHCSILNKSSVFTYFFGEERISVIPKSMSLFEFIQIQV
jgi:hypothetical protein